MSDTDLDMDLIERERKRFADAGAEIGRLEREERKLDVQLFLQRGPLGDLWRQYYIAGKLPK